jgi:hypothetical protein
MMVNALELFENFKNNQVQRALAESKLRLAPLQEQQIQFALSKGQHDLANEDTKLGLLARQQQATEDFQRGRLGVMAQAIAAKPNPNVAKPPPGYRATVNGNLEAIPGGPADTKLQGVLNSDTGMLQNSMSSFDRLEQSANETLNHPGLSGITGLRGAIPNIPGTAAADAQAKLNTLKSQVGFGVLQDMRNNSKTGGALGSVSDAEGKRLEANLAALENAQSEKQMKDSLRKIIDYSEQAKDRLRSAYNLKHGARQVQGAANPIAPPNSQVIDFNSLPK